MKQTWQIRFKKKCIDAGMNSKGAADVMGVSQSYLSEVLTGKKLVGPGLAIKLEQSFGLNALAILSDQAKDALKRERQKIKDQKHQAWNADTRRNDAVHTRRRKHDDARDAPHGQSGRRG